MFNKNTLIMSLERAFRNSQKALLLWGSSLLRIPNGREVFQGERGTALGAKRAAQYCSNKKNGSTKTRLDEINDLMKVQVKFQRRSMVMLRLLALIARADTFDHASLNAYRLFGQPLLADFCDQKVNHMLPAWCRNQAQGDQTFVHDVDGLGKTDLGGCDVSLLCCLQHQDTHDASGLPLGLLSLRLSYPMDEVFLFEPY